jgi:hypothetical protein
VLIRVKFYRKVRYTTKVSLQSLNRVHVSKFSAKCTAVRLDFLYLNDFWFEESSAPATL